MTKPQIIKTLIGSRTQKAFAERHGVIYQTVGKWLSGKRNICDKTLIEIAKKEGFKLTIELKLQKL